MSVFQTTGSHGAQYGGGGAGGAQTGTTASSGSGPACPGGMNSRPGSAVPPGGPGPPTGAGIAVGVDDGIRVGGGGVGDDGEAGKGGSACANPAPNPATTTLSAPTRAAVAADRFRFISDQPYPAARAA